MKIIFICLGNICRSPTAEAVFRSIVKKANLDKIIKIDSAGTHALLNSCPYYKSQAEALKRGYDMSKIRSKKIKVEDFIFFDLIIAMDENNLHNLQKMSPDHCLYKIKLLMSFSKKYQHIKNVPDPYYQGIDSFKEVLDYIEDACYGLLESLYQ